MNPNIVLEITNKSEKLFYRVIENNDGDDIVETLIFEFKDSLFPIDATSEEETSGDENKFRLRIVGYEKGHLYTGFQDKPERVNCFAQDFLVKNQKTDQMPIIHLVNSDAQVLIDFLYGDGKLPGGENGIPRSFPIIDSSIWNYFVPSSNYNEPDTKEEISWKSLFVLTFNTILRNYQRGLYNLEISQEFADLNARLVKESFLSGDHAEGVLPFIFHSEKALERLIKKEFDASNTKNGNRIRPTTERITEQKWKILLIDDKAKKGLSKSGTDNLSFQSEISGLDWNSKLAIIIHILKEHFKAIPSYKIEYRKFMDTCNFSDTDLLVEYVDTFDDAEKALTKNKYDIILLDYLLDKKNGTSLYGYEILDKIFKQREEINNGIQIREENTYKLGPHGRLFFIFISAYSSAVYERLLAEGLNRSEPFWHIAVGACPTNTPTLFLYNLLKLMEKQLEDSGVDKLSPRGIFDIVNKIYGFAEGEDVGKSVRYRANKYYQKVLDLHYLYRKMLDDVDFPADESGCIFNTKGSVLITNFMKKNVNLGGLLEHLTQLVHLTAFGTVRQWPEMWEEYIYFKAQFNIDQLEIDSEALNWNAREHFSNLCVDIEDHVLDLKSDVK